ncbi:MAG: sensor histidine kinase [Bacteroidales bacterium]
MSDRVSNFRNRIGVIYGLVFFAVIATAISQFFYLKNLFKEGSDLIVAESYSAMSDALEKMNEEIVAKELRAILFEKDSIFYNKGQNKELAEFFSFYRTVNDILSHKEVGKNRGELFGEMGDISLTFDSIFKHSKLDTVILSKYYSQELESRGINLVFKIKLQKKDKKKLLFYEEQFGRNSQFDTFLCFNLHRSEYGFYLNKEQSKPSLLGELQVKYSGVDWFIFRDLWLNLLLTILQKGFIVFAILYLVHIVLKQKEMSRIRSDFINNMTHEFKTPIATISAALEAMESFNALENIDKTKRYLGISRGELARLSGMIEKVLKISVWEKQGLELKKEKFDLSEMIFDLKDTLKLKSTKDVIVDVKDVIPKIIVFADKPQMQSVLSNLVDNAIKYSDEHVLIKISLRILQGERLELKIQDNGWGIAEKHLKHIFDKFYRIPSGNLYRVKGFGLGLSYVKKIIEEHRGEVKVSSKKNIGTCFTIIIPW